MIKPNPQNKEVKKECAYACMCHGTSDEPETDCVCHDTPQAHHTTNREGWRERLMNQFAVMFERAEREGGKSGDDWADDLEGFIRKEIELGGEKCSYCGQTERSPLCVPGHVYHQFPSMVKWKEGFDLGYQKGRKEERERNIRKIQDYFQGLMVIPFPERTKESLLASLQEPNNQE